MRPPREIASKTFRPANGSVHRAVDAAVTNGAIVLSGWYWPTFNVPERVALALAVSGIRVLHCENPVSMLRHRARPLTEVEERIFSFGPKIFGPRFNYFPLLPKIQSKMVVSQILRHATHLALTNPLLFYPHGSRVLPICEEMKRRGSLLVHVCMDYPLPDQDEHVRLSDVTLVIPETIFHKLRDRFGNKVRLMQQSICLAPYSSGVAASAEPPELACVPRPRLGYLGSTENRLNLELLRTVLVAHPDWHFVSFGGTNGLMIPNAHVMPWRKPNDLPQVVANLDVGFMPYHCGDDKNLHCVPLKLLDYFAMGIPVVSTPIINVLRYEGLVYFGNDARELGQATVQALEEPSDSPKRQLRMEIAKAHSLENLATWLLDVLLKEGVTLAAQTKAAISGNVHL